MSIRLRAFLIHLGVSSFLGLAALALVFLVWYPAPLQRAVGVTTIFFIVIGVDVTIGPMLTLIVFKPKKKALRFDLATIVILQLVAFGYGMSTVAVGRPVWLVFNVDRFDLVRAYEIDGRHTDSTPPEYQNLPWFGPRWVAARVPADLQKRNALTFEAVFAGVDLPQRPDLYQPLATEADAIRQKAHPLDQLLRYNSYASVQAVRAKWPDADAWLPMMSSARAVTVLLRKPSAEVVAIVDLSPWE